MVSTNDSALASRLDGIRVKRQKFICLNDNLEHSDPKSVKVSIILIIIITAILKFSLFCFSFFVAVVVVVVDVFSKLRFYMNFMRRCFRCAPSLNWRQVCRTNICMWMSCARSNDESGVSQCAGGWRRCWPLVCVVVSLRCSGGVVAPLTVKIANHLIVVSCAFNKSCIINTT